MAVILQSDFSRSELAQKHLPPTLRHDAFIVQPTGRGEIFDLLMRAVLHQPTIDVATRPYTPASADDKQYLAATSFARETTALRSIVAAPPDRNRNSLFFAKFTTRAPRILVAEDNEINQQVILGMLKNLGCEPDLACDGSVAVSMAIADRYDVILMDIHMPMLDGVTAMQKIRVLLADGICPPIVAMTAHALPGDRERYLSMGMNDYVSKPFARAT